MRNIAEVIMLLIEALHDGSVVVETNLTRQSIKGFAVASIDSGVSLSVKKGEPYLLRLLLDDTLLCDLFVMEDESTRFSRSGTVATPFCTGRKA